MMLNQFWPVFWDFLLHYFKISITHKNRRVFDAYEKTGFPESFAKHHDAYKKMSVPHKTRIKLCNYIFIS